MKKSIVICGYGNVSVELCKIISNNKNLIINKYNLDLQVISIIAAEGQIFEEKGIDLSLLIKCGKGSSALKEYAKVKGLNLNNKVIPKGDILVEATPTNLNSGEPGLSYSLEALNLGMDLVFASKGALVTNYTQILDKVKEKGAKLNYSGATAAALPTLDIGENCLSGSKLKSIKGILNGTTNYILTEMTLNKISFEEALEKAQSMGIAERNPTLDISGFDSGCKLVLIVNKVLNKKYTINDVTITGIDKITNDDIRIAYENGQTIKLIAEASISGEEVYMKVSPVKVINTKMMASVNGTNKCIVYDTDEMGEIFCAGGASDPIGAGAAVLKDIINMYKQ
ncbi:homoserine dehydrogenase [Clostridium folliculivorans]|uniref:Homoserine dehydrogenase n=1 Tax=Clostridium folliculivorans TaxID=2886038 RepID=A0A9W5Y3V5_9CLOT|nr:homoserine dehydrogenase [Clostridium folliculivorans]GKU25977.1 homoserine dehydrogenase [Clostridium folliculivorans]GKU28063.1 homoserine dehydrogenase [Clostridium folliculivorans]